MYPHDTQEYTRTPEEMVNAVIANNAAEDREKLEKAEFDKGPVKQLFNQRLTLTSAKILVGEDEMSKSDAITLAVLKACYERKDELSIRNNEILWKHTNRSGQILEDIVEPKPRYIEKLANTSITVKSAQARYIHRALMELLPYPDKTQMEVFPGVVWNVTTGDIEPIKEGA